MQTTYLAPTGLSDRRFIVIVVAVVLLAVAPFVLGRYVLHSMIVAMIFMLPAIGLNLIVGFTGLLSLAQAAFFGIGAYASALMAIHWGTPFYVNFPLAGIVAGVIAAPLAVPALRLRTTSFVMCTLGFVIISQAVSKNWVSVTRGDMGLSNVPNPEFFLGPLSFTVSTIVGQYYLLLIIACAMVALMYGIVRSAAGRNMIAIRENETLAESMGVPTWRVKLSVFVLSAFFAGLGGSVYVHYLTIVSPLTFQTHYTTTILIIVLGGGPGTITGAILGSFLFVGLSEALRIAPEIRMILYGLCLLVLVFWFPKGFSSLIEWFWSKFTPAPKAGSE
ncbi:MAG: branched-chain amino acid ABC transporter permease [Geminicoccaceae bacterium]|nr:branched-chain amino acid ABC transporter permease [Geminicoccaceae bacterium]